MIISFVVFGVLFDLYYLIVILCLCAGALLGALLFGWFWTVGFSGCCLFVLLFWVFAIGLFRAC